MKTLQRRIGIKFNDPALLEQALTHSSYVNENPRAAKNSNERLEFLGDAVLGLVVAERLFKDFPDYPEGELTRFRVALVRRETLAQIAGVIELGDSLFLGKGEEAGGGRRKLANLAGAFEALIAAVYCDQGLDAARDFVLGLLGLQISELTNHGAENDYKSQLQELCQLQKQVTPSYHLLRATGPDHDREFAVEVKAGNTVVGRGSGKSKKAAEMEAAKDALEGLSL